MRRYKITFSFAAILALSMTSLGRQDQPVVWQYSRQQDPLHGTVFDSFTLLGKYLTAREGAGVQSPRIVVLCSQGRMKQAYLDTGIVVQPAESATNAGFAHSFKGAVQSAVEIREDSKKPRTDYWEITNDSHALSFDHDDLTELLTGHMMGTERNWQHPTRRLIFGVIEFGGNEVEMQFATPEAEGDAPLVRACGLEVKGSFWRGYRRAK